MQKIFLLLLICIAVNSHAQQHDIDSFLTALKKYPKQDTTRLNLLNKLSFAYNSIDPSKGIALANSNIVLAKKLGSKPLLADAYSAKAGNFITTGLYDSAIYMYNYALPICQSLKNEKGLGTCDMILGVIYFYKADYLKSINYEKTAEAIFNNLHSEHLLSMCYSDLALAYEGVSDFDNSLLYYQKAMHIFEKMNLTLNMATVYGNLSEVYRQINNYSQALLYAQKCLAISKQAGDNLIMSNAYAFVGQAYFFMNHPQKAIDNYLQGLQIADKYNFKKCAVCFTAINGKCLQQFAQLQRSIFLS